MEPRHKTPDEIVKEADNFMIEYSIFEQAMEDLRAMPSHLLNPSETRSISGDSSFIKQTRELIHNASQICSIIDDMLHHNRYDVYTIRTLKKKRQDLKEALNNIEHFLSPQKNDDAHLKEEIDDDEFNDIVETITVEEIAEIESVIMNEKSNNELPGISSLTQECQITLTNDKNFRSKKQIFIARLDDFYQSYEKSNYPYSYKGKITHLTNATTPLSTIGFAELFGKRDEQQDALTFGTLNDFSKLSEEARIDVLKSTVSALQSKIVEKKAGHTGSTLCVVVKCGSKIYTVNVGDSTAYLVHLNDQHQVKKFTRLNKNLHVPNDNHELKRLRSSHYDKFITDHIIMSNPYKTHQFFTCRLNGLAMSRAMGDVKFEAFGLIHEPDIDVIDLKIDPLDKVIIINACDGLTEQECLAESEAEGEKYQCPSIEKIVRENHLHDQPEALAMRLAESAYQYGSHDNISVIVDFTNKDAGTTTYSAIFDGHGGKACSLLLRDNFHTTLIEQIRQKLQAQAAPALK